MAGDYSLDVRDDLSEQRSMLPPNRKQPQYQQPVVQDDDAFWYQNDGGAGGFGGPKNTSPKAQAQSKLPN